MGGGVIQSIGQLAQQAPHFRGLQLAAHLDQFEQGESLGPLARKKYARAGTHDVAGRTQHDRMRMFPHLRELSLDLRHHRRIEDARIRQQLERDRPVVNGVVGRLVQPAAIRGRNLRSEPKALRQRAA